MFVELVNGRGQVRYQPATLDSRMVFVCAMGDCIRTWVNVEDAHRYDQVKLRFRWMADLVAYLYERRLERALSLRYYARGGN